MSLIISIFKREELPTVARTLLEEAGAIRVFTFDGNLGAGKTTLIRYLCRELGYMGEVTSPTFSIINEYQSYFGDLCHMDLYRLRSPQEAEETGLWEYIHSGRYCFIEWPDIILPYIDTSYLSVKIESGEGENRKIIVDKHMVY